MYEPLCDIIFSLSNKEFAKFADPENNIQDMALSDLGKIFKESEWFRNKLKQNETCIK